MIGSRRARIDRTLMVTSAPLTNASSTLDQAFCSSSASPVASRPSFRIRITDGPRSPLVASREWKSASSLMQTREIGARSAQYLSLVGPTHADFGHVDHVPPTLAQQSGRG